MDSDIQSISDIQTQGKWQRLSPIALLYFAISFLRGLLGNIVYLIPAFAFGYSNMLAHPFIWLPMIAIALLLLLVVSYWTFKVYRFRVSKDNLEIRSGIFSKTHLNLPFSRIQNVKLEQPIYYRLGGYACLQLDTAGSAKQEAKLIALPLTLAQQLKHQILQHTQEILSETQTEKEDSASTLLTGEDEEILNQRSVMDLVIHGVTSNRIWIIMGGLAPFYDKLLDKVKEILLSLNIDVKALLDVNQYSIVQVGLYALSLVFLLMLVLVSFSVLGSIISFYGYTLSKIKQRYIRRSGLFTKHEVSMPKGRLQRIVQNQDWLDAVLNRCNLKLEQAADNVVHANQSANQSSLIVPSITPKQSKVLIDEMFVGNQLLSLPFSRISRFFIYRNLLYIITPIMIFLQGFAWYHHNIKFSMLLGLLSIVMVALTYLRWRRWGVATDQNYIYVRNGLFGITYCCFPAFKVQQCQLKQSVMMKKRELASVKLILASGSVTLPLIPEYLAYQIINLTLLKVESSKLSWMELN